MKKYSLLFLLGICTIFQSYAHVELIYPLGGETFNQGETIKIEWKILITHNTLNWDLFFSSDGGTTWDTIQIDIPPDTLSYNWVVPATTTTQGQIKIVMDNDGINYEDTSGDFNIVTTSVIGKQEYSPGIIIYPNPFHTKAVIVTENFFPGETIEFKMFDLQGREVYKTVITSSPFTLARPALPDGVYILKGITGKGIISGKLVLE